MQSILSVLKKVLRHPCIIAVEIGIVLMVTQLPLPVFLEKAVPSGRWMCRGDSYRERWERHLIDLMKEMFQEI